MDGLMSVLLIALVVVQCITLVELMLHRRAVRDFIERGYKDGDD